MLAPGVDPLVAAAQAARGAIDQARRLALQDPCVFLAAVLQDEVTGQTFRPAPIHEEWQDLCTQYDRLVLWAPIAHGKSSGISIGRVLYELAKNPSLRVGICTNTGGHNSLGVKILSTIKQYIEKSPRLRAVAPHLRPSEPWTQTSITVERPLISKDPTVQVFGIGGDILGARLDLLIFDDILDWEAVRTKAARDAVTAWLESTVLGRLADGSRVWAVGNPWDPDDSYHRLAKKPGWHSQVFRATHADGSPTWAERWTMESLARKRQDLGPREAARQLDCRARSDESSRFQSVWVEQCLKRGDGKTMVRALQRVPPGARVLVGVDLAVQEKDEADETSLMAVLVHPNRDRELLCIESGRWGGPVIVDKIVDFHQRYLGIFFVENNACFVPGTPVLTRERGYVPIEDVQVGEHTWTHMARWRPVIDVVEGSARKITPAHAAGSLGVNATPNHWFWMREAVRTPGFGGGHHRPADDPQWVSVGFAERPAYVALAAPVWPAAAATLDLVATNRGPARTVAIDEELAMFLGLYLAEGNASDRQVFFTLGHREGYLAEWVAAVMRRIVPGAAVLIRSGEGTLRVCVSSTALAKTFRTFGKSRNKCLPTSWQGWPTALRIAVVRGWLVGDGCLRVNNRSTRWPTRLLSGQTCSRTWAAWVRWVLFAAGMRPTISAVRPRDGEIAGRRIRSSGGFLLQLNWADTLKLLRSATSEIERVRWPREAEERSPLHAQKSAMQDAGDGHVWARLKAGPGVWRAHGEGDAGGPVWNLVVEEDASFTAEDYIVHNAQDYILQFARLRAAIPMHPYTTGRTKAHPEFGVERIAAEMAAAKWIIPNIGGACHPEVEQFVNDCLFYTPTAHTGDRLMSCFFIVEGERILDGLPGPAQVGKFSLNR